MPISGVKKVKQVKVQKRVRLSISEKNKILQMIDNKVKYADIAAHFFREISFRICLTQQLLLRIVGLICRQEQLLVVG